MTTVCLSGKRQSRFCETVLKSAGSAFENFVRDEYTTLGEVDDRIFSTSVDLLYTFAPFEITAPKDEKRVGFDKEQIRGAGGLGAWDGDRASESAREITLETFATDESASVQVSAPSRAGIAALIRRKHRRHCTRWGSD